MMLQKIEEEIIFKINQGQILTNKGSNIIPTEIIKEDSFQKTQSV